MDSVALHLHCIADPEHVASIVLAQESHGEFLEVRVEKKNKKRFDN